MANTQARIQLIQELQSYDHVIMTPESVAEYATVFDCPLECEDHDPKYCYDESQTMGLGSHILAAKLCKHFKVNYVSKHGIGSQLRECCEKLLAHFSCK